MELYIGGYAQGKLVYVQNKYPQALLYEEGMQIEQPATVIWNAFHQSVKNFLEEGLTQEDILNRLFALDDSCENLIVICDEIGNGIVPMDPKERHWREETGRILCGIAFKAIHMERIHCGIGQVIK